MISKKLNISVTKKFKIINLKWHKNLNIKYKLKAFYD